MDKSQLYRLLPKVDKLTKDISLSAIPLFFRTAAVREVLDRVRTDIAGGRCTAVDTDHILALVKQRGEELHGGSLIPVINATGVVLHTNLGRAPISPEVFDEAKAVVCGYSNLEYDLETGSRGDRYHHIRDGLRLATGAEDAVIVNNNAAAVFLILNTFCRGKEVIVSRGELVEIGGSFRVPDVMAGSGAVLKEVGTTNKTRISDYEQAVTPDTAMMMKVHKSNYTIVGFTDEASTAEVAEAAKATGVISYYDAGGGLIDPAMPNCGEPPLSALTAEGLDLISASGDKLFGGVQAGIILGRADLIARIKKNPMLRMLRVDKTTLAITQAVLKRYLTGELTGNRAPQMLMLSKDDILTAAEHLARLLRDASAGKCTVDIVAETASIGGGTCPTAQLETWCVRLTTPAHSALEKHLRMAKPPVVCRAKDDSLLFDPRTLLEGDAECIATHVAEWKP